MLNTSRLLTCLPFLCLIFELKIISKARNSSYRELLLFIRIVFRSQVDRYHFSGRRSVGCDMTYLALPLARPLALTSDVLTSSAFLHRRFGTLRFWLRESETGKV